MKNFPRLAPIFISFSVVLAAVPQAAVAQVVVRAAAVPAAAGVGAAASVNALSGAPALAPLSAFPSASASLTPGLAAPSAAAPALVPAASPSVLSLPAAAPALAASVPAASLPMNAAPSAPESVIPTPGAAATGLAAEAAAYGSETEQAAAPSRAAAAKNASSSVPTPASKGLVSRLKDVVLGRASLSSLFDSSSSRGGKAAPIFGRLGLQEHKPIFLPNGSRPDDVPTTPSPDREPTVLLQTYAIPGARDMGGLVESSRRVLAADPNDMTAVVAQVRALVDGDRARYGVSSSELRLVHARKFEGRGSQADTIFVVFDQVKNSLEVNGGTLSFTIKVLDGKPTVISQLGQVFPQIDVNTESVLTEDQIMDKIAERVGMPAADAAGAFQFFQEKIIYSRGAWRHVKLYVADGLPFMIAVDLSSGLVFAWDNRTGLIDAKAKKQKAGGAAGKVSGKAVDHGPILPTAALKDIPLAFLNLTVGGKTYTTDKDGKFSAPGLEIAPEGLTLTATLSGPFVNVQDTTGQTLTINVTLKPGDGDVSVVFNKDATLNDENALAQVSAFHKVNLAYNFLRERKLTTEQMDKNPIVVKTNIDDECNAFYTPGSPSLNFFKSSANCVNSAYDTVADHEYGHYWDDMTGGIRNGGLSEGWGDMVSMYLLNNPIIGEHFLKVPRNGVDYIRNGNNTYKYNEFDEVHEQGQAWQGFGWKLRAALMKQLGDAEGAAVAEALVLPTMFAKAATIPDAIAQVLVNAMGKDGTIQYEKLIRDTALIHGITLPSSPKGFIERLVDKFTAPLRLIRLASASEDGGAAAVRPAVTAGVAGSAAELAAEAQAPAPNPAVRRTLKFTAGALLRRRVANEIRRYMDETGLKYSLNEYKSWTSSDFLLVIEGPQDQVRQHAENISRWLSSLESANR